MKVTETDRPIQPATSVGNVTPGTPVKFVHKFNEDPKHSVYMVMRAAYCYFPEKRQYDTKVPVANLRAGNLCYVSADREVIPYVGEITITRQQRFMS